MAIELERIEKSFNGKKILYDFSMRIEDNKITFLNGPSGIGKTTILNLIMGICLPECGTIKGVEGKRISCVFQDKRLLLSQPAETNIECVIEKRPQNRNIFISDSNAYKKTEAQRWLELVGLKEQSRQKLESLSGGMQQLVSIARALASPKDILLLDEPFSGLDGTLRKKIIDLILANSKNIVTILVTHEVNEGLMLADQVYSLTGPPLSVSAEQCIGSSR
jgi:NitT/TauT family transport system ATP-binding protein